MQKRDGQKAVYNRPTTAFGCRREILKQYKDQETFTAIEVSYVKVQIMLVEKIENLNYLNVAFM